MKQVRLILAGIVMPLALGCGVYSFSASGKKAFSSINIAQFESTTIEYQFADRITDAVINAFIRDNTVPVKEASKAEAIMTGILNEYRRDPYTYDRGDVVSEYVVKVKIHVKVERAGSEDIIWEEDFYAEGIYGVDDAEESGQQKALDILTANILDRTTKNW